ncbi:hypothetical protein Scep_010211 [Stephania cephalantha]|uniref:Uncharacterized protein n=1 Tax=Stephania cephalantha TaxID=152367 RepID=A0AAP0PGV0_9MAGN
MREKERTQKRERDLRGRKNEVWTCRSRACCLKRYKSFDWRVRTHFRHVALEDLCELLYFNLLRKLGRFLVCSRQRKGSSDLDELIMSLIGIMTSFETLSRLFFYYYILSWDWDLNKLK